MITLEEITSCSSSLKRPSRMDSTKPHFSKLSHRISATQDVNLLNTIEKVYDRTKNQDGIHNASNDCISYAVVTDI